MFLVSLKSSQPNEPIVNIFKNAIEHKLTHGQSPHREIGEINGFLEIENACKEALQNQKQISFLWFSPPGRKEDGYGDSGRTFFGRFNPESNNLIMYSLIDHFTNEERQGLWHSFRAKHGLSIEMDIVSDVDFLSNPIIAKIPDFQSADIIKFIDDWLSNKYKQRYVLGKPASENDKINYELSRNKALEEIAPFLDEHIKNFIDLIKRQISKDILNKTFRAMTKYADDLYKLYQLGRLSDLEVPLYTTNDLTDLFGNHQAIVTKTSCPISGELFTTFNALKPYDYLNQFIGPMDDFYCPFCGEKIKYGSNTKMCPRCKAPAQCS